METARTVAAGIILSTTTAVVLSWSQTTDIVLGTCMAGGKRSSSGGGSDKTPQKLSVPTRTAPVDPTTLSKENIVVGLPSSSDAEAAFAAGG
jgi:hypothetical protein